MYRMSNLVSRRSGASTTKSLHWPPKEDAAETGQAVTWKKMGRVE